MIHYFIGAGSGPKVIFPRTANISMKATVGDSASLDCIANENSGDPSVVWDRENSHLPASATVTKSKSPEMHYKHWERRPCG